jgi:hypothetical protein
MACVRGRERVTAGIRPSRHRPQHHRHIRRSRAGTSSSARSFREGSTTTPRRCRSPATTRTCYPRKLTNSPRTWTTASTRTRGTRSRVRLRRPTRIGRRHLPQIPGRWSLPAAQRREIQHARCRRRTLEQRHRRRRPHCASRGRCEPARFERGYSTSTVSVRGLGVDSLH